MLTIALRALKDKKIFLLSFVFGGIGMAWMYAALFPTIGKLSESYSEIIKSFPEAFLKAFGIDEGWKISFRHCRALHFCRLFRAGNYSYG